MKEYCVDLEIAEELEDNNFPQTIYGWYKPNYDGRDRKPILLEVLAHGTSKSSFNRLNYYRLSYAPISEEILKELPVSIYFDLNYYFLYITKDNIDNHQVYYEKTTESGFKDHGLRFRIINEKLSNCLAKTWLYLKKEGYLK
jgi:hypothetical protein